MFQHMMHNILDNPNIEYPLLDNYSNPEAYPVT